MYDGSAMTAAARGAFLARFEIQVDPEGRLPEAERPRRADAARHEHMSRLAYRARDARARKRRPRIRVRRFAVPFADL
jgi:hypothetical protein